MTKKSFGRWVKPGPLLRRSIKKQRSKQRRKLPLVFGIAEGFEKSTDAWNID